jgi:hypothetical protein
MIIAAAMPERAGIAVCLTTMNAIVMPREGGASSTPQLSSDSLALWKTGSPAFAGDDRGYRYRRAFKYQSKIFTPSQHATPGLPKISSNMRCT